MKAIGTFNFVFNLLILDEVFGITKLLSTYLQTIDISISSAHNHIVAVLASIKEMRSEEQFEKYWSAANDICENLGLEGPELPRRRKVPARLGGGSAQPSYEDVHHYYMVASFYPLLDVITGRFEERFSENDLEIIQSLEKLLLADSLTSDTLANLETVAVFYGLDFDDLKAEVRVFTNHIKEKEKSGDQLDTMASRNNCYWMEKNLLMYFH